MRSRPWGVVLTVALAVGFGAVAGAQQITGAGATFPYPIYSKWFDEYHKKFPNITFNYQSLGSGAGVQQITAGTVDFGASDYALTDKQIQDFKSKRHLDILHYPTVMGAAVPVYNIRGLTAQLNFTPDALVGIFLGKITKWNDPAIAGANPGVKLPSAPIIVVHRSDGSGTTFCFTDYLSKVSKEWETKVGRGGSVNWPVGLGGKGNEGVSGQVKQVPNTIGYIELSYAVQNKMTFGKVKNSAGVFVAASLGGVSAAAASAAKNMPDDFRVSITDAAGQDAYPISTFTWLLIPNKIPDAAKEKAIKDFLHWMLTTGQTMAAPLDYAPLPKAVVIKEEKAIAKIM